jgi:Leucine-rich repeat (LRR) protein
MSGLFSLLLCVYLLCCVIVELAEAEAGVLLCSGDISAGEYQALEALYNSTNGADWAWSRSDALTTIWHFPATLATPCADQWQGLTCVSTGDGCQLVELALPAYSLEGTLPSEIGLMTALEVISLELNILHGEIPAQFGQLTLLFELYLFYNFFTGHISTTLGNLVRLQELEFHNNHISGPIPSELGRLTALVELSAYSNRLTSSIPSELGQWQSATSIGVYENEMSGSLPSELGQLSLLQYLYLYQNNFTGNFPSSFGQMRSMEYLALYETSISGPIPSEIGLMTSLIQLLLYQTDLSGPIPSQFGRLTNLQMLYLFDTSIDGSVPTEIALMSSLQDLYLDYTLVSGTTPTELGLMTSLQYLYLFANCMSGSIPSELGQVTSLIQLSMYMANFTGSLPTQLGNLVNLEFLDVYMTNVTGSLPSELGNLGSLQQLYLFQNRLTGTLSTELGRLTALQEIGLWYNSFSGTLPSEFGLLSSLQYLYAYNSMLTGQIPSEIGQLTLMESLALCANNMTGTLPAQLGLLTKMQSLDLYQNSFWGPIPSQLGELHLMQIMDLHETMLSGEIPSELAKLLSIQQLYIYETDVSGTIPSSLGDLTSLTNLYLFANKFSGSLPSQLGQLVMLEYLALNATGLTGTVPSEMSNLSKLIQLFLEANSFEGGTEWMSGMKLLTNVNMTQNFFSGSLPVMTADAIFVDASSNYFDGSIGSAFESCKILQYLDIGDNLLSSSMPSYLTTMATLEALNVSNNAFTGSLESLTIQGGNNSLRSVDISHNQFGGSLSAAFFQQRSLSTVLLYDNCFSGYLPSELCLNSNLQSLFLESLTGNCASMIAPGLQHVFKGSFPIHTMLGSIPSCIWSMSQLSQLHLTGNGFTGSLHEIPSSSGTALTEVLLASNKLTGSVPLSFQTYGRFQQLDLSSNKLSGTLNSQFAVAEDATIFDLSLNRLSGEIPGSFEDASTLNVLNGNLFQCQSTDTPSADPDHSTYVCGSDDLNIAGELAVAAFVIGAVGILVMLGSTEWRTQGLQLSTKRHVRFIVLFAALLIFVLLPVYLLLKYVASLAQFSTHADQYGWVTTAAFMHGWLPVLVILAVLAAGTQWLTRQTDNSKDDVIIPDPSSLVDAKITTTNRCSCVLLSIAGCKKIARMICMHTFHAIVVLVVNSAYVVISLNGLSQAALLAAQLSLSCFKLGWNYVAIPVLVNFGVPKEHQLVHQLSMVLLSFLGGPFISTFLTSGDCFLNVFTGQGTIQSSSTVEDYGCYDVCATICNQDSACRGVCLPVCSFDQETQIYVSSTPPWNYSYQCSSTLLLDYIPVLMFTYALSGAIIPLASVIMRSKHGERARARLTTTIGIDMKSSEDMETSEAAQAVDIFGNDLRFCRDAAVLLTFGLASPLLAAEVGFGAILNGLVFSQRLNTAEQQISFVGAKEIMVVCVFSGIFWSLFVFDMIGDVYGNIAGGCCVLLPLALPVLSSWLLSRQIKERLTLVGQFAKQLSMNWGTELTSVHKRSISEIVVNPQHADNKFSSESC